MEREGEAGVMGSQDVGSGYGGFEVLEGLIAGGEPGGSEDDDFIKVDDFLSCKTQHKEVQCALEGHWNISD